MRIQTIKIVVFARKDANTILQKKGATRGFRVPLQGLSVFLCLQMKQHDFDFPTQENGKKIILFFFSFYTVVVVMMFIVSEIFKET